MFGFLSSVIIAGAALIGLLILGTVFLLGFKILKGGNPREVREESREETRIVQELYQGLERLEGRVESLETLLLEGDEKGGRS